MLNLWFWHMQKIKSFLPVAKCNFTHPNQKLWMPEHGIFEGHEIVDFYIQQIRDFVFNSQL